MTASAFLAEKIPFSTTPGIKFKSVELNEAQNLYKLYEIETNNILNQIR